MFNWLKPKTEMYIEQLSSFDYSQLELEYAYKKSGGKNNTIISEKEMVKMVFENNNPHDSNAIAVYYYNLKVGYIHSSDTLMFRIMISPVFILRLFYYNEKYIA